MEAVNVQCPECSSSKVFCNGHRMLRDGSEAQRYLCGKCGRRFSDPINLKTVHNNTEDSQISATIGEAKNLVNTTVKKSVVGDTKQLIDTQKLKGLLLEFEFYMQKQGYKKPTINIRLHWIETLAKKGADLYNPESVKAVIALQTSWGEGTKTNIVDAYTCFLEKENKTWKQPIYKRRETIPFIPSEAELDMLIGASGKILSIFLQGLKETAADPGELAGVEAKDINKEARAISLNHPVKGHRPRVMTVSPDLIHRIEPLMQKTGRLFDDNQLRKAFLYKKRTMAYKMSNPRLREITFITFRHWKATMEYHRTKDILHVQRFLGHKAIQNTLIYIDLEAKLFVNTNEGYTVRIAHDVGEAAQLTEAGYEYTTGAYNDGGKIYRKPK